MSSNRVLSFLSLLLLYLQGPSTAAERFELRSMRTKGLSYGSVLVPTGWYPESPDSDEDADVERFGFSPVTGLYPVILIDVAAIPAPTPPARSRNSENDFQTVSHSEPKPLPEHSAPSKVNAAPNRPLLEGGKKGKRYFDPVRLVTWSSVANEANSVVKIEFDRDYRYQFQFILEARDAEKSVDTIRAVMDNLRFDLKKPVPPPRVSRSQMQEKVQAGALVTFAFDRRETPQSRALYLSLAIGTGTILLTLLIWERILKSRNDRQRIAAADEAIQERLNSPRH